ncbi:Ff.00g012910.m01.CDS01 [Fusarium sp. VM40]|nr:Ff.00g012910.m01.CDS01 [Fusarium sp. VM40]
MARTDIHGNPISCIKCKTGHRDNSCNDSHPGPCFYRGKRGRPTKGEEGRAGDPLAVPDCLLRPSSGVPGGPAPLPSPPAPSEAVGYPHLGNNDFSAFAAPAEASSWDSVPSSLGGPGQLPMVPPPTPPFEAVRHPQDVGNGHAAFVAPPYLPSPAPSPSVPDFSGQFSVAPVCQPQIGGNGYDFTLPPQSFPQAPSLRHLWAVDEPTALVSDFFSKETPAGTEDQGPQDTEMAPSVSTAPRLPDLSTEPAAAFRPGTWGSPTGFMLNEDFSELISFDDE